MLDGQEDEAAVFIELLPSPQVVVVVVAVGCHQISVYKYLEAFLQLLLLPVLVLTEKQTKSKPKQDLCAYVNFSNAPQQTAKDAQTEPNTKPTPTPDAVADRGTDGDGSGAVVGD